MIYHLIGELVLAEPGTAVIDCNGVGYKLTISSVTLGKLTANADKSKVKLFTYMSVREDAVELFGFYEYDELTAFKMLITVSGVGPKAAMAVLSVLSPDKLAMAVSAGDSKLISSAQGVGAKTAARIVLELKDKITKEIGVSSSQGVGAVSVSDIEDNGSKLSDVMNTLTVLGYTKTEASYALKDIDIAALDTESIIRAALKKLMK